MYESEVIYIEDGYDLTRFQYNDKKEVTIQRGNKNYFIKILPFKDVYFSVNGIQYESAYIYSPRGSYKFFTDEEDDANNINSQSLP